MRRLLLLTSAILLCSCVAPSRQQSPPVAPVPPPAAPASTPSEHPAEPVDTPLTQTGTEVRIGERILASGVLEIGSANAPVSLLLFTNHACDYCGDFQEELVPRLTSEFVRDGRVRIGIVPFAMGKYPNSKQAAGFLLCSARQGRGIDVNALLFKENMTAATAQTAINDLQLNREQLESCLQDETITAMIDAQQSFAKSLGITLVPTYFINGKIYTGLPEYSDLRGQIEEALNVE